MGDDRTQINIAVNPERKEKWVDYVENNNEASSLSHLIRLSVEREIARDEPIGGHREADVDLSGVDERFDQLETRLDELSRTMQRLVEQEEQESIEDLAGEVYDILPRIEDEDAWRERLESGNMDVILTDEDATEKDLRRNFPDDDGVTVVSDWYVTVADIGQQLGVSEYRARLAVERVEEAFSRVKTHPHQGDTYVYEVD